MVDLEKYLDLYKRERAEIEYQDDEAKIREEVEAYEAKVRAEFADKKQKALDDKDNDIRAFENLLARISEEEKNAEIENAEEVEDVETNTENDTNEVLGGGIFEGL